MGIVDELRRLSHNTARLVSHVADEPEIREEQGTRYMVFHLREAPGIEFRLKMFPTTPRRRGDRVEVSYTQVNGAAVVETLFAAPNPDVVRRRHRESSAGARPKDSAG